jgi:PilZ domain-containing protein
MRERRQHQRFQVQIPAKIVFDCSAAIDCVIVDQSASGAGLKVQNAERVPDAFELLSPYGLRTCQVAWRTRDRLGATLRWWWSSTTNEGVGSAA